MVQNIHLVVLITCMEWLSKTLKFVDFIVNKVFLVKEIIFLFFDPVKTVVIHLFFEIAIEMERKLALKMLECYFALL